MTGLIAMTACDRGNILLY